MKSAHQLDLLQDAYRVDERISARAKYIRIEIRSPNEVRLTIPRFVSKHEARAFLLSREAWIREKIAEMRQRLSEQPERPNTQLRWDGSDLLPLRGKQVPLKVQLSRVRRPAARIHRDGIDLFVAPNWLAQPSRMHKLLRDSLKQEAEQDAAAMLETEAARLSVEYLGPRIADQKTLWGSCTAHGKISLSWRLVMAPPAVLRYVVIHELCHIRHHDHSERFWRLVARQMPGFETHRRWLREHGPQLHWWLAI